MNNAQDNERHCVHYIAAIVIPLLFCISCMMSLADLKQVDHSGKLGYEEFKKLWTDIRQWKVS